MSRIRTIRIKYNEYSEAYYYTCPFCGKDNACEDGKWDGCRHMVFGYEDINERVLFFNPELYHRIRDIILLKRVSFLEGFHELWADNYQPQEKRSEDPETLDEAKSDAVDEYLDFGFSFEDFKKVLRCSNLKSILGEVVIAETDEDPEGFGKTYYVLSNSEGC